MRRIIPFLALLLALLLAVPASAQLMRNGAGGAVVMLAIDGASAGNGADLTEDIIKTYTVPANTLVNNGDVLEIYASGTFGATTDTKQAFVRLGGIGGTVLCQPLGNTASQLRWASITRVVKTGTTPITYECIGSTLNGTANGTNAGTTTITMTAPMDVVVTGKNTTSSAAGSITVQYFSVALIRAPGS